MQDVVLTEVEDRPNFDLFSFMEMSHESRIGGAAMERLEKAWKTWSATMKAYLLTFEKVSYLAVWLPKEVEEEVNTVWQKSPSEGFLSNSLAQFLCMSFLQLVLPEVEDGGCAPSPRPTEKLRKALEDLGVPYKSAESSLLSLPYAVVTHYPFKGGCEICHLQDHCPKGQGKGEDASIVLPGYDRADEHQE